MQSNLVKNNALIASLLSYPNNIFLYNNKVWRRAWIYPGGYTLFGHCNVTRHCLTTTYPPFAAFSLPPPKKTRSWAVNPLATPLAEAANAFQPEWSKIKWHLLCSFWRSFYFMIDGANEAASAISLPSCRGDMMATIQ